MVTAHWFNPANDDALAADAAPYTPSGAAQRLGRDASLLPLFWAGDDDVVVSGLDATDLRRRYGLRGRVAPRLDGLPIDRCAPWGWSRDAAWRLARLGAPPSSLPAAQALKQLRNLSHRRLTVTLNRQLGSPCVPVEAACEADLPRRGRYAVKLPWSSSGRGVLFLDLSSAAGRRQAAGMIARQGSVLVEPQLAGVLDLGALFSCSGGECRYRGLSLFNTGPGGSWRSSIIAPESCLRGLLPPAVLPGYDHACALLATHLTALVAPFYSGWLGVDMMVYDPGDGSLQLAPCLEVNLRMTMGVAAHLMRSNPAIAALGPARLAITPWAGGFTVDITPEAPAARVGR